MIENNIIKSPVHLAANVARLLQTNKMTVAALCTHPNINMWAKYKPVCHPDVVVDRKNANVNGAKYGNNPLSDEHGNRINAKDGDHGVVLRINGKLDDILKDYNITVNDGNQIYLPTRYNSRYYESIKCLYDFYEWAYIPPRAPFPFRVGDFLGYRHDAIPPITLTKYSADQKVNSMKPGYSYMLKFRIVESSDDSGSEGNMSIYDLGGWIDLSTTYLIAITRYSSGATYYCISDETVIGENGEYHYQFDMSNLVTNVTPGYTYKVFVAFAQKADTVYNLIPIPMPSGLSMPIKLNVYQDASELGAGIKDWTTDVWFGARGQTDDFNLSNLGTYYALAYDLMEEGSEKYCLETRGSSLAMKVRFYNSSSQSHTISRNAFTFTTDTMTKKPAEAMFDVAANRYVDSVTVSPNQQNKEVIFVWNQGQVLPDLNGAGFGGSEIFMYFNDKLLFSGTLIHRHGDAEARIVPYK